VVPVKRETISQLLTGVPAPVHSCIGQRHHKEDFTLLRGLTASLGLVKSLACLKLFLNCS